MFTRILAPLVITLPWFGVYSYFVFLAFLGPWWAIPLSYVWLVGFPLFGVDAIHIAVLLPLALLAVMVWPRFRVGRDRRTASPASFSTTAGG